MAACVLTAAPPVHAQESCPNVAIVTLPAVTWADVERVAPFNILQAAEDGAVGSMAVREPIDALQLSNAHRPGLVAAFKVLARKHAAAFASLVGEAPAAAE